MGGSFVMKKHIKNNRTVITTGLIFAPQKDKRNFLNERFIKSPFKIYLIDRNTIAWRSVQLSEAPSFKLDKLQAIG